MTRSKSASVTFRAGALAVWGRQAPCPAWLSRRLAGTRSLSSRRPRANHSPEKRKVDSSILSLTTTTYGQVRSALTGANAYRALPCPQPSDDRSCPCVTVVRHPLSHADRTPCASASSLRTCGRCAALAARGAVVRIGSGWTNVLARPSVYDAARRWTATQIATRPALVLVSIPDLSPAT